MTQRLTYTAWIRLVECKLGQHPADIRDYDWSAAYDRGLSADQAARAALPEPEDDRDLGPAGKYVLRRVQ